MPAVHTVVLPVMIPAIGDGSTVIVKFCESPIHPFAEGVTVIVAVSATEVVLTAAKDVISPVPVLASPMLGLLFVHSYVVPVTEPVKDTGLVASVLHKVWSGIMETPGVGFTDIVKF